MLYSNGRYLFFLQRNNLHWQASGRSTIRAILPIDLETRLAGDGGTPVAAGEGAMAQAYARIAEGLVKGGMA